MDIEAKSLEWKYTAAMLILTEDGVEPNFVVLGESTTNKEKLTDKQVQKKMRSLPEVEEGQQSVFWEEEEAFPEQEIFIRLLNLKASMLEKGIETYLSNFLPPKKHQLRPETLSDPHSKDCIDFVHYHHQLLNVPSMKYFTSLFGEKMTKKQKKNLKLVVPQVTSHFTAKGNVKIITNHISENCKCPNEAKKR